MNDLTDIDIRLLTGLVATFLCVLLDLIMNRIQQWQRERAGVGDPGSLGFGGKLAVSFIMNIFLCMAFTYTYPSLGLGSGSAYLVAAVVWLIIAIPMLATSRFTDEIRQQTIATRILVWLLKMATIAGAVSIFME